MELVALREDKLALQSEVEVLSIQNAKLAAENDCLARQGAALDPLVDSAVRKQIEVLLAGKR